MRCGGLQAEQVTTTQLRVPALSRCMRPRSLAGAVLAVLVLSAVLVVAFPPTVPADVGGSGPGGSGPGGSDGESAVAGESVAVVGGEIDADQDALWAWTQRALDRDVNATPAVTIYNTDGVGARVQSEAEAFRNLVIFEDPDDPPAGGVLAFVSPLSLNVSINADQLPRVRNGSTWRTMEGLLVHEFAHVVQFQTPVFRDNQLLALGPSTDELTAYRAMVEGGAEYFADDYTDHSSLDEMGAIWADPSTPAAYRLSFWPYYRGLEYLQGRLEAPADLWSVYEDRPPTTAAILRGEVPGDEPPVREVAVGLEDYHVEVDDRMGAAFAEVALSRTVDPARALEIAAEWRWDALRSVQADRGGDADTGDDRPLQHVWVTEWRSPEAADEFEAAMERYLAERFEPTAGGWGSVDGQQFSLRRVDDESVALVVGSEQFLETVAVRVEGPAYSIDGNRSRPTGTVRPSPATVTAPRGAAVG